MRLRLFDLPEIEPSQAVGFAGNIIDRLSEKRSDDAAEKALAEPEALIMLLGKGRVHLSFRNGSRPKIFFTASEIAHFEPLLHEAVLLGRQDERPLLAAVTTSDPEKLPEPFKAVDYRSVYMQGLIPGDELGALAQAAALIAWHENYRYCGRCGTLTEMRAGGYKRVCPHCEAQHFPRTDPVAIMLAVRGDRCLLARSPHFAPDMYSCLAGFIEPGETIEAAVRRETREEAGVPIGRVAYHASQPWPFPYSLMIGCHAEALSDEIIIDRTELEDGRWFERGEVLAMLDRTHPQGLMTPPPGAIAAHLIRSWAES
ncbi:NADH pyrophosphatase [Paramesorhizobium deserti]|uniref:NAD(+) diphosphatase n=1 Tax=Paramesorhizobium deserti TaxID=1494590 RepID=A0A135I0P8_9HYPH|nr:NAD(+) diphosphatase [Paramesorhizobium deserti]KXF79015.1 NADH pyrophosphatase [Paramesorhizobium deserti]